MTIQENLHEKITTALSPMHLQIENESRFHHRNPDGETHFKVVVVSSEFVGKPLLERHRLVQECAASERARGLHALTLRTLTPQEWELAKGQPDLQSPVCRG